MSKLKADWDFLCCGWKKAGTYDFLHQRIATKGIACIYYLGVSLFGWLSYYRTQKENH